MSPIASTITDYLLNQNNKVIISCIAIAQLPGALELEIDLIQERHFVVMENVPMLLMITEIASLFVVLPSLLIICRISQQLLMRTGSTMGIALIILSVVLRFIVPVPIANGAFTPMPLITFSVPLAICFALVLAATKTFWPANKNPNS